VIENVSSRVRGNKSGALWSTIRKVVNVSLDPAQLTFQELIFRPLGAAGPWNFYKR